MEVGPVLIGEADRSEVTADLETSDEVADGQLGGIGGGKNVVEGREVWLGKVLFAGEDKLVGSEISGVLLLVGGVGEDDDLGTERLGELDSKI